MKTILFLSVIFCTIALPALGDLTDTDLNRIRLTIKEELKEELKPIKADIVTLKTDVAGIKGKLDGVDKQFESVEKQIPHAQYAFYGLIALSVVIVAAQLIPFVQEIRKDRALEKQVEILTQQIETLKQQLH